MQFIIIGLALLVLVLLAGRYFTRADPKVMARHIRRVGGWGLLGAAIYLGVRGNVFLALPLALFAMSLLGKSFPWQDALGGSRSQGQRSTVRTEMIEMTLDHDSGRMEGRVLKGQFEGRPLAELSAAELSVLLEEARASDPQSAQLLEAYIDRLGARRASSGNGGRGASGSAAMTVEEAYAVLGLKPGASREDIQQAHRALMKKYHPDQGGTTYLASKINEAKDVLLRHVG
jgi:hypothetical protein